MKKILMRLCAAALSFFCFCSSGAFAMFGMRDSTYFPVQPFHYNDILVGMGYPAVIAGDFEHLDAGVKEHWEKYWWTSAALLNGRIDFDMYVKASRAYALTAEIQIRRRNTENGRSEKWERVNKALRESADWVFHAFLADFFNDFYKKDCRQRFEQQCLWRILDELNSDFVKEQVEKKLGEELSREHDEDLIEQFSRLPIDETDIDECFSRTRGLLVPVYPYTDDILIAVQFIGEGLYYMKIEHLVVFFSTLYAYFFDTRTKYSPERNYIVYCCIEKLYHWLITDALKDHIRENAGCFDSYQYRQLLELKKVCDPDSEIFRSRETGVMAKLKYLGL